MRPVRHGASNVVYCGPAPGIGDLWCQRIKPNEISVVYEFDEEERALIAAGGRVELRMYCEPIPPISMVTWGPSLFEPVGEHGWRGQSIDDVPDVLPEHWPPR